MLGKSVYLASKHKIPLEAGESALGNVPLGLRQGSMSNSMIGKERNV